MPASSRQARRGHLLVSDTTGTVSRSAEPSRSAPDRRATRRRSRRARRRRTSRARRARAPTRPPPRRRRRALRRRRRRCARRARSPARPSRGRPSASGFISVGSGFIAARTTISSPFDMPPSMPPARFVSRRSPPSPRDDLVVRLRAAQLREREAVADLDALHRLDAHQRRGEPRVEAVLLARIRAEARAARRARAPRRRRRACRGPCAPRRPSPDPRPPRAAPCPRR